MTMYNRDNIILVIVLSVFFTQYCQCQHKLLWISINGIGSKHIDDESTMPFLSSIKKMGAYSSNLEIDFLADTYSTLFTMSTGLYSEYHGIVGEKMCKENCSKLFSKSKSNKDWWWVNKNSNYTIRPIWSSMKLYQGNKLPFCIDWPGCDIHFNNYLPIFLPGDSALDSNYRLTIALNYITKSIITNLVLVRLEDLEYLMKSSGVDMRKINETIATHDKLLENTFNEIYNSNSPHDTNILITSSFGGRFMNDNANKVIPLWTYFKGFTYKVAYEGKIVALYVEHSIEMEKLVRNLSMLTTKNVIKIYQHKNLPKTVFYPLDDRTPDLFIVAQNNYCLKMSEDSEACKGYKSGHTIDNKEDAGFVMVVGPDINKDIKLAQLNLVDIYPLLCALLFIDPCNANNGTVAKFVTALSMNHPILSDLPGAKTVITTVIIIAILFTVVAFAYSYIYELCNENDKTSNIKSYLKSAQTYEIIDQSCE